jgi:hypothetical protein
MKSRETCLAAHTSAISRIERTIIDILPRTEAAVVSRPQGKVPRLPTPSINREAQDEHNDLRSAIQRSRHDVIVLDEQLRMVLPQIPLCNEAEDEVHRT